ncbi:MAG TPA: glycosyltransferase [Vicinamibacterales bacterium]|nr:glycosyltransferase [Vicinamibacterales bacterium]
MNIVILGLSITSSWGNGHATTYRALVRALSARGHVVLFLERDSTWYAENRDLPAPPYCHARLYGSLDELEHSYAGDIEEADLVIVGSYVPDGIGVADLVLRTARGCRAFYDIDTPVTLAKVQNGGAEYIERRQIPEFDLYLSFTGGPTLDRLERGFHAQRARALYCSVDQELYSRDAHSPRDYDLGYLGTYSNDRQTTVDELLLQPARRWSAGRFVIAGAQYPESLDIPPNVTRIVHLSPTEHRAFYNRQRFTLNVTRRDMIDAGYSPSVRLFEAAACGTPIITDEWRGLSTVFSPGHEVLIARHTRDVTAYLHDLSETERTAIGERARQRVLQSHTSVHRAMELERYVAEVNPNLILPTRNGGIAAPFA